MKLVALLLLLGCTKAITPATVLQKPAPDHRAIVLHIDNPTADTVDVAFAYKTDSTMLGTIAPGKVGLYVMSSETLGDIRFFVVIIYDHKRRVIIGHSPLVFRLDRGPTFVSGSSIGPDDAPRKPAQAS